MIKFKTGDEVEFRDSEEAVWEHGTFTAIDPICHDYKYIVRAAGTKFSEGHKYCRRKKPNLKADDPVWVSNSGDLYFPRHFRCWEDYKIVCWPSGQTSHSCEDRVIKSGYCWNHYSIEKP